jgi:predicted double-glycine peptidase
MSTEEQASQRRERPEFIPQPPYSNADRHFLARREQGPFFAAASQETANLGIPGKQLQGPCFAEISQILQEANAALSTINPAFTPTHLLPQVDLPAEEFAQVTQLHPDTFSQLALIRRRRLVNLNDMGERLGPADTAQFALNRPPYRFQGDSGFEILKDKGCANACFRMIYEDITGETLHECVVMEGMQNVYGSHMVEDEAYLRLFYSKTFKDAFPDKPVNTVSIAGANLQTIAKIREKLGPKRKVYGIVDLQTENVETGQWHTNILLGADGNNVIVHDPSQKNGGPGKAISKQEFYKRWAVGYNRAHLVITE